MTDFGTMSVTRSLSISTRNPSTSSSVSHFQSNFSGFYAALPLKDHDLSSVTYPVGFYGNHGADYFTSQSSGNGGGLSTSSPSCHQQQHHHHHHQQHQRARSEWITFSKPFLLKLVEKLCQLSFENDSVSQSSTPEVNGVQGRTPPTPSEVPNSSATTNNDVTPHHTTTTSTASVSNKTDNSGSRKSRLKSRPVKFVRPFESSEERHKSEGSDCGDINVESDDEMVNNNSTVISSPNSSPQCDNNTNNNEKNKDTLKREREIGDDSDTEHVNVEDDDDDIATNRMNLEKSVIDTPSISISKSIFNPIANPPSSQIFNPIWSEYLKMNLTSTYQTVFNSPQKSNRQSWAAFNKSLVYKMFDDVLDNDKIQNQSNPIYQTSQSSLQSARFLFANNVSNHVGVHFSNGLDKHLGGCGGAYCGEMVASRSNPEIDRESKKSSQIQSRHKRLRDGFVRTRQQLINRRNRATRNSNLIVKTSTQEIREKNDSICHVPILGALLRSNDNKTSTNKSSQSNNNKNIKTCHDHLQQQQQIPHKTTANNNWETISSDITLKNGFNQISSKVESWPKWVALDKCQVRSLVDSLVATMMATNDSFCSPSLSSSPLFKSRDESEMQVDYHHDNIANKENENNDDSNRSYDDSTGSCTDQSQLSSPQKVEVSEAESSALHCVDRDSETETNFSGDTQLEHSSDQEECSRNADEMSDDGESSSIKDGSDDTDGCARMECHSTHHRCSIKWKSNMVKRMKAEEPDKEG